MEESRPSPDWLLQSFELKCRSRAAILRYGVDLGLYKYSYSTTLGLCAEILRADSAVIRALELIYVRMSLRLTSECLVM